MKTSTAIIIGVVVLAVIGAGVAVYMVKKGTDAAKGTVDQKGYQSANGWKFGSTIAQTVGSLGGAWMQKGYGAGASQQPGVYGGEWGSYGAGGWT